MKKSSIKETVLLSGREFTMQDLSDIQETARMFPDLSRNELAKTICENLEWFTHKGDYKITSCLNVLQKLQSYNFIELPSVKNVVRDKKQIKLTSNSDPMPLISGSLSKFEPIILKPLVSREERELCKEYIERYHQLGYKQVYGAQERYFILTKDGDILGCMIFAASAWALKVRDEWIGWSEADRSKRLHLILNNSRFLVLPWVSIRNLASRVLSLLVKRIRNDWEHRYNFQPVLLETFVDTEKYLGTSYRAANWIYLGDTAGRGRMDRYHKGEKSIKKVFVYPLVKDFRNYLLVKGAPNNG